MCFCFDKPNNKRIFRIASDVLVLMRLLFNHISS